MVEQVGRRVRCVQDNEKTYALKIIKISQDVTALKEILNVITHPFIATHLADFEDSLHTYFLVDFVFTDLQTELDKMTFSTLQSLYYTAQLTLVFEYLHGLDIVYRSLKPGHVLLNAQGNIQLTDFELAKVVKGSAEIKFQFRSFVGLHFLFSDRLCRAFSKL